MKTTIEAIRSGLISQLADLDRDLQAATAQVNQLKASRRQVAAAIKALGGKDPAAPSVNPAPKKIQVRAALDRLLEDNSGGIATKDLEALVAEKIAADYGCSAMGLALRLREILAAQEFTVHDGQVQKAAAKLQGKSPK